MKIWAHETDGPAGSGHIGHQLHDWWVRTGSGGCDPANLPMDWWRYEVRSDGSISWSRRTDIERMRVDKNLHTHDIDITIMLKSGGHVTGTLTWVGGSMQTKWRTVDPPVPMPLDPFPTKAAWTAPENKLQECCQHPEPDHMPWCPIVVMKTNAARAEILARMQAAGWACHRVRDAGPEFDIYEWMDADCNTVEQVRVPVGEVPYVTKKVIDRYIDSMDIPTVTTAVVGCSRCGAEMKWGSCTNTACLNYEPPF